MTRTATESFTLTHAKYLASKVTSDMWRCRQLYALPSEAQINDYGTELALMLRDGFVSEYEFGFLRDDQRLLCWRYCVTSGGDLSASDQRPGGLTAGVNVAGASFYNRMTWSAAWSQLTQEQRDLVLNNLPFRRVTKEGPNDGHGYWQEDRVYSSQGISMSRRTFRPFGA